MTNTLVERWGDVLIPYLIRKDRTTIREAGGYQVKQTLAQHVIIQLRRNFLNALWSERQQHRSPLRKEIVSTVVPTASVLPDAGMPSWTAKQEERAMATDCDGLRVRVSTKGWKQ